MVDGVLVSMKCVICEAIISVGKHIMSKWNNLEKHMGKWQVEHNVLHKSLKKIQAYYEKNNKHSWNLVLFVV
jgi:hypothetical protein